MAVGIPGRNSEETLSKIDLGNGSPDTGLDYQ
jgi:hypothetical protein